MASRASGWMTASKWPPGTLTEAVRAAAFAIPGALGVQEGGYVLLGQILAVKSMRRGKGRPAAQVHFRHVALILYDGLRGANGG